MTAGPAPHLDDFPAFPALFAAAPAALLVLRADPPAFTIVAATDAYLRATLQTRDSLVGRPVFDALPDTNPGNPAPTGVANLRASLATVLRTGATHAMPVQRYDLRRPDGTWEERRWAPRNSPVVDPDGVVRYIVHFVEDVTGRVRADAEHARLTAEVAAERERLRTLVLQMPAPVALLEGPEHRFVLVNEAYRRVSGGGRDVTGLTPPEAFPELAGSGIYELFDRVFETGEAWEELESLVRYDRDGTGVADTWFDLRFVPVRDAEGRVTAVLNLALDVTEQVCARRQIETLLDAEQAALAEAEAARGRLALLADASAALLRESLDYETTLAEAVRLAVPALADYAAVDMVGPDGGIRRLAAAHRPPAVVEVAAQAGRQYAATPDPAHPHAATLARGEARLVPEVTDEWMRAAARSPEHLADMRAVAPRSLMLVPLRARERVAGLLILASTTSGRRYGPADLALAEEFAGRVAIAADNARLYAESEVARREAEAARAGAEAANRAKADFLAMMSHELRTPLNAIGGYAQLMELGLHGPVTPDQVAALDRIQRGQQHLLGLINAVLNYAKLEAGHVEYRTDDVPAAEALTEVTALMAPQSRAAGLVLGVEPCAPGIVARADAEKVRQVLLNLLSNAIKFTGSGGAVTVGCGPLDQGRVAFTVADTGRGIAADQLERVFEPFMQVDQRLTRAEGGTGLGLAISRDLARGMGGDLTVESALGRGSVFTFTLPRV